MNTNILTKLLGFLVIGVLLPAIASAAPSIVPFPKHNIVGDKVNLTLIGQDSIAEFGGQIAVWDPLANPALFPKQNCSNFPGPSGGTKWILTGSGGATVTYTLPLGASISIVSFGLNGGSGESISVTPNGGASVSAGPYQWAQVNDGVGTDNLSIPSTQGQYLVGTCGEEITGELPYQATDTFEAEILSTVLTKSVSSPTVEAGSTVTYTYSEYNNGTLGITNLSIVDPGCPSSPLTNGTNNLSVGETWVFTCNVTLNTPGIVTDTATAHGTPFEPARIFTGVDALETSNTVTVTVIHPNISLTKSASANQVENNTQVTYPYVVNNTGDTNLTVNISDDKLGIILGSTQLAPGASQTSTANSTLTATTTNTATATGMDQTGANVTAQAQATVTVIVRPAISLTKNASASKVENGSSVTYTYNVTNTGNTNLTANISDDKLGIILGPTQLAPGASQTSTANATLTATTTNTATATGMDQTGAKVTVQAQTTVNVIHPAISLIKTPSQTQVVSGANVTYTYNVTNTGDTTLSNVTITDNVFGNVSGSITLSPSQSQTFTEIEQINNDTTNIATATGIDQFGVKVSANANATVTVIVPPAVGRMTGGGSFFNGTTRVTHGFELHCNASKLPNNLEVNWKGNRFHLQTLTNATCVNDPTFKPNPPTAPFNTYIGTGIGDYNGVAGAKSSWTFTDHGEPGKKDTVSIKIWDVNGNLVLSVPTTTLDVGNQQAHAGDP